MSFLNKARAQAQKTVGATAPVTPAAKPAIPGKPNVPGKPPIGGKPGLPKPGAPRPGGLPKPGMKPPVPGHAPTPAKAKEETPLEAKSNPFLKKKDVPAPTETIDKDPEMMAPIEEAKAEVKATKEKAAESKKTEEKVEVPAPVEEKKEEAKTETKETAKEEVKEEPKEEVKETKKKSTSKKKTTTKAKETTSTESTVEIPGTDMEYADAMVSIKSNFVDPEWEEFRTDIINRLNEIHITSDMTPAALKETISNLSGLRESIWVQYNDTKTAFEKLTAKEPEGLIERIKKLNATGSNAEERKINSILAVMNYKDGAGRNINLFELLDETRERFNFLKSVMDSSQYKTNVLVTMLGSLKLEK